MMLTIVKKFAQNLKKSLIALLVLFFAFSAQNAWAVTRMKDDTDLSKINLYQFTLTQENMEILEQSDAIVKDVLPATGNWKESTVFSLKIDKSQDSQSFDQPLRLKFTNAGEVYGKKVDAYVTIRRVGVDVSNKNADYHNPAKTVLPFLTVDENWGSKSIQIMDYIYPDHPTVTHDIYQAFSTNTDVTAELKYQDGTPTDLKMVMLPSDIDVVSGVNPNLKESFSLYDIENTVGKIVMNNANKLNEETSGGKTTWTPQDGSGTSGAYQEHNVTGLAVRSASNLMSFSYGTTASCGGLFGFYTEVPAQAPTKEVNPEKMPAEAGKEITYTTQYKMPVPGTDVIGDLDSMKMVDTFDNRLDFKSLAVTLEGQTLTEASDYTVTQEGQKVTVTIDKKHLMRGNGGKNFTITYKVTTNAAILQNGQDIENQVTQEVDNVVTPSNTVKTQLLYEKSHEFVSGTAGKELPKVVQDLLPAKTSNIENGTTVTPDQPSKTKVSLADGNWIFKGYDKTSEVIDQKNANFVGTWVFEEFSKPVKDVVNQSNTSINQEQVNPDDVLTYTISYTNTTDAERDVTITDTVPTHTSYVENSADQSGVYTNGLVTWTKKVAVGETYTVSFKVKVDSTVKGESIDNTARVADGLVDVSTNTTKNPTPVPQPQPQPPRPAPKPDPDPSSPVSPSKKDSKDQSPNKKVLPKTGEKVQTWLLALALALLLSGLSFKVCSKRGS